MWCDATKMFKSRNKTDWLGLHTKALPKVGPSWKGTASGWKYSMRESFLNRTQLQLSVVLQSEGCKKQSWNHSATSILLFDRISSPRRLRASSLALSLIHLFWNFEFSNVSTKSNISRSISLLWPNVKNSNFERIIRLNPIHTYSTRNCYCQRLRLHITFIYSTFMGVWPLFLVNIFQPNFLQIRITWSSLMSIHIYFLMP